MKLKKDFLLRQVAGTWVVVAVGKACVDFDGMLTLNETGALLWQTLEKGGSREDLVDALTSEYEVSVEQVGLDVDEFLESIRRTGCLEE